MLTGLNDLLHRLRALLRRQAVETELDEELLHHLDREAEKYRQAGASPEEAGQRAKLALGGPEQVRQQCREARGTKLLEDLLLDLRFGFRKLLRSPGFTIVAILTLALGIGACTAIFSVVNAVLLRSLPYGDAKQLVYLYTPNPNIKNVPVEAFSPSYADFFDLQRQSHSFSAMSVFEQESYNLRAQQSAVRVATARVDGSFFSTLQSSPEIGRAIDEGDNLPGHNHVAVIGHSLWESIFGGSSDVLTKSLLLDGRSYRVIGVMPPEFGYPHDFDLIAGNNSIKTTQVWVPLALSPQQKAVRDDMTGEAIGRLKPGVSIAQAQAEMSTIMARLDLLHRPDLGGWGRSWNALIRPFRENVVGAVRPLMWTLLAAVCLVLLIACGNAANLLLARAASRTHELGMRATLGAGRGRLLRQMLTESLLLAMTGGLLGVGLAYGFVRALLQLNPGNIPRMDQASLNAPVLCFTVIVALLTSVLFGTLPALSVSHVNLIEFLKTGGNWGAVGTRSRIQSRLIVAEVALVVVLLAGAGLLLHSYWNVASVQTGFSSSTVSMDLQLGAQYRQSAQRLAFFRSVFDRIGTIPGVQSIGLISHLPLTSSESLSTFWVDGYANEKGQLVKSRTISPQYFSAMGIPLMRGRFFADDETSSRLPVAIVNQAFAVKYFGNRDPIGSRVRIGGSNNPWMTVVGVAANVQDASLEAAALPEIFTSLWQSDGFGSSVVVIRSSLPPRDVAATVRSVLQTIDPNLALTDIHTMGELISEASARQRFQATLLAVFAAMALALSLVGFYGLLAYSVKQRTAEIGLRIALGSSRARVLTMVLRQGVRLVLAGLLFGLAGALALTRALANSLYGVRALDPVTFLAVPALLLLITLATSLILGWRASGVDPVSALRCE